MLAVVVARFVAQETALDRPKRRSNFLPRHLGEGSVGSVPSFYMLECGDRTGFCACASPRKGFAGRICLVTDSMFCMLVSSVNIMRKVIDMGSRL